jgi:hypothetical protein
VIGTIKFSMRGSCWQLIRTKRSFLICRPVFGNTPGHNHRMADCVEGICAVSNIYIAETQVRHQRFGLRAIPAIQEFTDLPYKRSFAGSSESRNFRFYNILSKGHPFTQQKSRITFSGNPAIFFKIRGFPHLPHDGFGFFCFVILEHDKIKSQGLF